MTKHTVVIGLVSAQAKEIHSTQIEPNCKYTIASRSKSTINHTNTQLHKLATSAVCYHTDRIASTFTRWTRLGRLHTIRERATNWKMTYICDATCPWSGNRPLAQMTCTQKTANAKVCSAGGKSIDSIVCRKINHRFNRYLARENFCNKIIKSTTLWAIYNNKKRLWQSGTRQSVPRALNMHLNRATWSTN